MPVLLQHGRTSTPRSIEDRLQGPIFDDLVVIVPTRRRIRHLVREVMTMTGKPVTPAFPFYTLDLFARKLYDASESPRRIVSGPVQALLLESALTRLRGRLEYFAAQASNARLFAGTLEKLLDAILLLKESGVLPAPLVAEADAAPLDEQKKLRDVAAIYTAYEEELERVAGTDAPGILAALSRSVAQEDFNSLVRRVFPDVDFLSLAGFDQFREPEINFIRLLTRVPGIAVTLLFDYQSGNPALFGHLEANYHRFRELGFSPLPDRAPRKRIFPINTIARPPESSELSEYLAMTMFQADGRLIPRDLQKRITLLSAPGRREEVVAICKLIKSLLLKRPGLDPGSICVATIRPQLYADLFREEGRRYGVPVNVTDRFLLSRAPVVSHIMGLLRVPLSRFSRDAVVRAAGSPYFTFGTNRRCLDVARLAGVSGMLRISGGLHNWLNKIDRQIGVDREKLLQRAEPQDEARLKERLNDLEVARADVVTLAEAVKSLDQPCAPRQFVKHLCQMLESMSVRQNLVFPTMRDEGDLAERTVRAYVRFLGVIEEVGDLLEFQFGAEATHTQRTYVEHLTTALARERYNVREQFGRGVLVTSIDETRGLPLDTMIVAGLVDGEFPDVYQPEVFLSPDRRKERERYASWQNKYLFYQAATNWTDHLYLTYPEHDGELDLVRSSFLDALLAIARVEEWRWGDSFPLGAALYSDDEYLHLAAVTPADRMPIPPPRLSAAIEEVRRSALVERERANGGLTNEYNGVLPPSLSAAASARLARLREQTFSVTQLESYGGCPYRFFAQRLLRLNAPGEFEEELTPIERGSLLHESLFEFYLQRRATKKPPIPGCSDVVFEDALNELTSVVETKLATLEIPDAFWELDRELLLGGRARRRGLLREFLEFERARTDAAVPTYFEVSFGGATGGRASGDPELSSADPVTLGSLRLRGKVDRVEVGDGYFTILDYKTSSVLPTIEDIDRGLSLQLPLYLKAIEKLLRAERGDSISPVAGLYYRLRSPVRIVPGIALGDYRGKAFTAGAQSRQVIKDSDLYHRYLDDTITRAESFVQRMAEGNFPLTSPDNVDTVCKFCDYKSACRIQSVRRVSPIVTEDQ